MKAPTDKSNDIIQILVTRACDLFHCSNCTQLLPMRGSHGICFDPVHMSPDVFRQALRSLDGWPGVRAMFGGNPCVHPRFDELCEIMRQEVPDPRQRGLWTNNLRGKGAIVAETFIPGASRFNLNLHADDAAAAEMREHLPGVPIYGEGKASHHAPILLDWRDMGLSYEQWSEKREQCDINRHWSAAIVERYSRPWAYFCEVASSIDAITGENHGVPAVPGWWRWKMDRFDHQVTGCCDKGCGVPLRAQGHDDTKDTYDVSDSWANLTVKGKPRHVARRDSIDGHVHEVTDYVGLRS